jgi:hypothetical protein
MVTDGYIWLRDIEDTFDSGHASETSLVLGVTEEGRDGCKTEREKEREEQQITILKRGEATV